MATVEWQARLVQCGGNSAWPTGDGCHAPMVFPIPAGWRTETFWNRDGEMCVTPHMPDCARNERERGAGPWPTSGTG